MVKILWGGEFRLESGYLQPNINWSFDPTFDMWGFQNHPENPANISFYQNQPGFELRREQLAYLYQRTDLNAHLPDQRCTMLAPFLLNLTLIHLSTYI
jgi:hypothetical protein